MNILEVYDRFVRNLQAREGLMTEDNIRYYWFAAMYDEDSNLNHYTLEHPYYEKDGLDGKELDLRYENGNEAFSMEIKFHRKTEATFAHTSAAGAIFDDLQRLKKQPKENNRRFFLYVTDKEMHKYFLASKNVLKKDTYRKELNRFYTMQEGSTVSLHFEGGEPKTFYEEAFASFNKAFASSREMLGMLDIPNLTLVRRTADTDDVRYHVRLYELLDSGSEMTCQDIEQLLFNHSRRERIKYQFESLVHHVRIPKVTITMLVESDWTHDLPQLLPNLFYVDMRKQKHVNTLIEQIEQHASDLICLDHISELNHDEQTQYELSQLLYFALSNEEYTNRQHSIDFSKYSVLMIQHEDAQRPFDDFFEYGRKKQTILI